MSEQASVTPELLVWARETAGLKIEEVVGRFDRRKVTVEVVRAWESGEEQPTYIQLERLAYEIYKRPIALFFFPTPPEEQTIEQSFRSLNGVVIETLSYRMRLLLRKAQSRQIKFIELAGRRRPTERSLLKDLKFDESSIEGRADSVREYLGIDLSIQSEWGDTTEALKQWRRSLEESGIFVFKEAFKEEEVSGFCLHDEEFPIIYVNNSKPKSRQIFTLFHELAHLLFQMGGVDFRQSDYLNYLEDDDKKIEIACNRFAGKFLVPDRDFQDRISGVRDVTDGQIQIFADRYHVSREVILRKFFDLDYINQDFYNQKVTEWASSMSTQEGGTGGDYYLNIKTYLSDTFVNLAFQRYYHREITVDELSEYIGVKTKNLEKFETTFLRDSGK